MKFLARCCTHEKLHETLLRRVFVSVHEEVEHVHGSLNLSPLPLIADPKVSIWMSRIIGEFLRGHRHCSKPRLISLRMMEGADRPFAIYESLCEPRFNFLPVRPRHKIRLADL